MPNWRKLIQSGSDAELNSLYVTTNITASTISASSGLTASLTPQNLANVVTYNSSTGEFHYTASSGLGGGTSGVTGLNDLTGNLILAEGDNVNITNNGNDTITFSVATASLDGYATETYVLDQTSSLSSSISNSFATFTTALAFFAGGVGNVVSVNGFDGAITISEGTGITINTSDPDIEISASLNLQQVTDNGNTTTATIYVGGITHQGDTDTGIIFIEDQIQLNAGGQNYLDINSFPGNDYISMSADTTITGLLHASTSYDDGTHPNVVVYDTQSNRFYHTGSYGTGGTSLTGLDKEVVYFNGDNTPDSSDGFTFDYSTNNLFISGIYNGNRYASNGLNILDYKVGAGVRLGDVGNEPSPQDILLYGDTITDYDISSSQDIYSSGSKVYHTEYAVEKYNPSSAAPLIGLNLATAPFTNTVEVASIVYTLPSSTSSATIKIADLSGKINSSNIDVILKFEGPSSNIAIMTFKMAYSRIDNNGLIKLTQYGSYHGDNNILQMFGNIVPETFLSGQVVNLKLTLNNIPFALQGRPIEIVSKYDSYTLPFNI